MKYFAMLLIVFAFGDSQNIQSPCRNIFRYEFTPNATKWNGILTLRDEQDVNGVFVKVSLNESIDILTSNFGLPRTKNNRDYIITNENIIIPANTDYLVKFSVKYSGESSVPVVNRIRINGRQVCPRKTK